MRRFALFVLALCGSWLLWVGPPAASPSDRSAASPTRPALMVPAPPDPDIPLPDAALAGLEVPGNREAATPATTGKVSVFFTNKYDYIPRDERARLVWDRISASGASGDPGMREPARVDEVEPALHLQDPFEVELPPGRYDLSVEGKRYRATCCYGVDILPGGSAYVRIDFKAERKLTARVHAADGRAIPSVNVAVEVWFNSRSSSEWKIEQAVAPDAEGRFEVPFDGPSPSDLDVTLKEEGFTTRHLRIRAEGEEDVDLGDVVFDGGRTVFGRVIDETGAAVEGAVVANEERMVTTTRDGRFRLEGIPWEGNFWGQSALEVGAEDFVKVSIDLSTPQTATPSIDAGDVVLRKGVPFGGIVFGPNGEPLAGATVYVSPRSVQLQAKTGDDGRFLVPHVDPGPEGKIELLQVLKEGCQNAMRWNVPVAEDCVVQLTGVVSLKIALRDHRRAEITSIDDPIALVIESQDKTVKDAFDFDGAGSHWIRVPPGRYSLRAVDGDGKVIYEDPALEVAADGSTSVEIVR